MTPRYRLTERAVEDIVETWEYVNSEFGPVVADRVVDEPEAAFELLAEHPKMGRTRPEIAAAPWRLWPVGPSLVAYRSDEQPIVIARIARAAMDWRRLVIDG